MAKKEPIVYDDLGSVADSLTTTAEHLQDYVGSDGMVSARAFAALSRHALRLEAAVARAMSNKRAERQAKSEAALLARLNKVRELHGLPPRTELPLE